jgi:hypothetical protein
MDTSGADDSGIRRPRVLRAGAGVWLPQPGRLHVLGPLTG